MNGTVDASAPRGNAGAWLMDPADVTISTGSDTYESGNPSFTPTGVGESVINVSDITTDLNNGTSVTITTGGDSYAGANNGQITVATPITLSASSNNNATLTLSAYSNIVFNTNDGITAPTTGTGKLNVILDADNGANASGVGGNGSGYIYFSSGANITTNGGNITMGGGNGTIGAGSGYAVGSSSSGTQYGIYLNDIVNAGGGNIIMDGQGGAYTGGSDKGIEMVGATVKTSGSGNISLTGIGGTGGTNGGNHGVSLENATNSIINTGTGFITIQGTGGTSTGTGNNQGINLWNGNETIENTGGGNLTLIGVGGGTGTHPSVGLMTGYSGTFTIGGTGDAGNINFQQDSIIFDSTAFGGSGGTTSIKTTGNIQIEPYTTTTAVNVATGSGGLQLTGTYLGYLSGGSYTIGNANDTGNLTVGTYSSWNAPVTFLTKSTGSISVIGDQTATGSGAFTFTGGPVALTGNITTAGGNVTFNPAVTLGQNDTINAGIGNVTFGSTVDGDYNLTASAGNLQLRRRAGRHYAACGGVTDVGGQPDAAFHQRRLDPRRCHRRHSKSHRLRPVDRVRDGHGGNAGIGADGRGVHQ